MVSTPRATSFVIRVDRNPAMFGTCSGTSCDLSADQSRRLTEQLRTGRNLAIEVFTVGPRIEAEIPITGFREALAQFPH